MRISRYIFIAIILLTVLGFNRHLFSWGLFNLFSDRDFNQEGLERAASFDPDKDILYLPLMEDKDIFEAVRDLSICRKKSVRMHLYKYLTSHRAYVIRAIEKSYIYQDIIDEVFENNKDVPRELSLLPLLESGFDPQAVSKSNAVGLWQFLHSTSTPLGLERNKWLDERKSIQKSTEAALRHLVSLHSIFKSWGLALAAYNGGGGYVSRALKQTGTDNFWDLRETGVLREETSDYVPKFLALLLIYKNQRLFGIKEEIIVPDTYDIEVLTVNRPINIEHLSKLTGLSMSVIKQLNPELNGNITPPINKTYNLLLPTEAIKRLKKNKDKLYQYQVTRVRVHRVKSGECLSVIAQRYKKKQTLS